MICRELCFKMFCNFHSLPYSPLVDFPSIKKGIIDLLINPQNPITGWVLYLQAMVSVQMFFIITN